MTFDICIEYAFRFCFYVFLGFTIEVVNAATLLNKILAKNIQGRVPKKYLEGFISIYMIPIHGFGIIIFEKIYPLISNWYLPFRYVFWSFIITLFEAASGFVYDKILGYYPWDYYEISKYKIFKRGYSLWTLLPLWGLFGLFLEFYTGLIISISPAAVAFIKNFTGL